jgi:hypothetical protein
VLESESVAALHAEYAQLQLQLQNQPPSAFTDDFGRSVRYYAAELAFGEASGQDEAGAWIRDLFTLEAFVGREGRMPRENSRLPPGVIETDEKMLTGFVRSQRRLFGAGRLCSYQVRRLLCVPGFSFHPLEDLWDEHLEEYRRFTDTRREAPKLRSDDPLERRLAAWGAKARLHYRRGTLSKRRVDGQVQMCGVTRLPRDSWISKR